MFRRIMDAFPLLYRVSEYDTDGQSQVIFIVKANPWEE